MGVRVLADLQRGGRGLQPRHPGHQVIGQGLPQLRQPPRRHPLPLRGPATFPTLIHEEPDMLVNMNDQTHLDRSERGCLVLLWIASPITALAVWGFVKLVLFFKWAINEDLRGRYDGVAPLSAWIIAWWETAWLLILVGVVGFLILAPLYGWALGASIRWFKLRRSRR